MSIGNSMENIHAHWCWGVTGKKYHENTLKRKLLNKIRDQLEIKFNWDSNYMERGVEL